MDRQLSSAWQSTVHFYRDRKQRFIRWMMAADISQIDRNLYLSDVNAATSPQVIRHYKIKHVITANTSPLAPQPVDSYKHVEAEDLPQQDMISYFPETYRFIDNGVSRKENVLVHCIAGMSRSASIVIAYLMKKKHIPVEECIENVHRLRPIVDPNAGFRKQLRLYENMRYEIDVLNKDYRLIVLTELVCKLSRATHAYNSASPQTANATITRYFSKLARTQALHNPDTIYKCKKCRAKLFTDINIISDKSDVCTSIYIEPQTWMRFSIAQYTISHINCPQCAKRIGGYDFVGINCDSTCTKHGGSFEQYFKVNANDVDACRCHLQTPNMSMPSTSKSTFYADEDKKC